MPLTLHTTLWGILVGVFLRGGGVDKINNLFVKGTCFHGCLSKINLFYALHMSILTIRGKRMPRDLSNSDIIDISTYLFELGSKVE